MMVLSLDLVARNNATVIRDSLIWQPAQSTTTLHTGRIKESP